MRKQISFEENPNAKHDFEKYFVLIDGEKQVYHGKYLNGAKYDSVITADEEEKRDALEVLSQDGCEFPFHIKKFEYNGFMGTVGDSYIKERARFIKWTGDPGIATMMLDNGKTLNVPSFAIPGQCLIPIDKTYNQEILFGKPSKA